MAGQTGDFIHFFVEGNAFLQVLELHGSADFGQDREGVGIPLDHDLAELNRFTIVDLDLGAVNNRVALTFAAFLVDYGERAVAVHDHQVASLRLHRLQVDKAHSAVVFGIEARLLGNSRCRTTDVEGTHGELRSGFAD